MVLDKAELEKLAFQRVAKNIIKTRENKHNGIRFFQKADLQSGKKMKAATRTGTKRRSPYR